MYSSAVVPLASAQSLGMKVSRMPVLNHLALDLVAVLNQGHGKGAGVLQGVGGELIEDLVVLGLLPLELHVVAAHVTSDPVFGADGDIVEAALVRRHGAQLADARADRVIGRAEDGGGVRGVRERFAITFHFAAEPSVSVPLVDVGQG